MPGWVATLIVGAVSIGCNILATAFFFGRISERVDSLSDNFTTYREEQRDEQTNQWSHINDLRADVGKVKGKLGVNGH